MEQLLAYLNQFYPMTPACMHYLRRVIRPKHIAKGEYLLRPDMVSRHIYFIVRGLVRTFYVLDDGTEVSSWFLKEQDLVVSVLSFYDQVPSFEYIQTLEPTEAFYISYEELNTAYHQYPEFNFIARVLELHYFKLLAWRLYAIQMQRADKRFEWLRDNHPEIIERVPQKYISSYINQTPVTLSKMKSKVAGKKPSRANNPDRSS
jgi:CRP-like cAMP-binding protein